jgi:hypothetical protein
MMSASFSRNKGERMQAEDYLSCLQRLALAAA